MARTKKAPTPPPEFFGDLEVKTVIPATPDVPVTTSAAVTEMPIFSVVPIEGYYIDIGLVNGQALLGYYISITELNYIILKSSPYASGGKLVSMDAIMWFSLGKEAPEKRYDNPFKIGSRYLVQMRTGETQAWILKKMNNEVLVMADGNREVVVPYQNLLTMG